VPVKLTEHPLAVHTAVLGRVVKNVDFPKRQQKLAFDGIAHNG
jgi:hypothetical protein